MFKNGKLLKISRQITVLKIDFRMVNCAEKSRTFPSCKDFHHDGNLRLFKAQFTALKIDFHDGNMF